GKYNLDANELHNTLNKSINKSYLSVKTTRLSNELLETLEIMKNCTNCKGNTGKYNLDGFHELINKIENCLAELEKEQQEGWKELIIINKLSKESFEMDNKLNRMILCKGCKGKKIKKLTDKCGNEKIARFLYECKLNQNRIK